MWQVILLLPIREITQWVPVPLQAMLIPTAEVLAVPADLAALVVQVECPVCLPWAAPAVLLLVVPEALPVWTVKALTMWQM